VRRLGLLAFDALWVGATYLFIYLPVAVLVLFSFHEGRVPVPPFEGPSLRWYEAVIGNGRLTDALGNSLLVGILSSAAATLLGFLAAWGLARYRVPGGGFLRGLIVLPLTVSYLIVGMGLLIGFAAIGLPKSLVGVGVGHVVINLPLAFSICFAQMGRRQAVLEQAARDLGARELQVLLRVTLPLLWPALFASFALSFTLSWDEFVIAFLLANFDVTLPVVIWGMLRTGLDPQTNAAGTMVFIVSLVLVVLMEGALFGRRRR
jgi:spermidine/putrescine transport system permease protein